MKSCYLAGPMRGYEEYNFPAFHAAAAHLREQGWEVFSPAERDLEEGFDPKTDKAHNLDYYMQYDLPAVCRSDAVVCLLGWEKSQGARLEARVAVEIGHPVYLYDGDDDHEEIEEHSIRYVFSDPEGALTDMMRKFETGATRNVDTALPDYEGFLSPLVLQRFGEYMNKHRTQADGIVRDADNWQKGIPLDSYMKSGLRHVMDWWLAHRGHESREGIEDALCGVLFNAMGYLHERLKSD